MAQTRPEIAEFVKALDETQYLSPPRLQAYQRRLLARLLDHARRETDFYAVRLDPIMRADGSCDWDRWHELPILTRSEAQDNFAGLCARSLPPVAGSTQEDTSSGSTGRPLRHLTTEIQNLASACAEPITGTRRDMRRGIVDTPPEMPRMAVCRTALDS